jgi:hypothetical protein
MNKSRDKSMTIEETSFVDNVKNLPVTHIGGQKVFNDFPKLKNHLFGDIIMIIELYNSYIKLYEKIIDLESLKEDVILSEIDFSKFIQLLIDDKNSEKNFKYFLSIIETLLRIIMNNDKSVLSFYYKEKIEINRLTIQDLCRIILQIDRKAGLGDDDEEDFDEEAEKNLKVIADNKKLSNNFTIFLYSAEKVSKI